MELAGHQRILLGLMRENYQVQRDDESYFHQVATSRDLQEARGNVLLWRVYVLERTCVLTVALLRQRGMLEARLQDFIRCQNVSPFREYQPLAFLAFMARDTDALVVSVSQFELALMKVREGDSACYEIEWQTDPYYVLHFLAQDLPLELPRDVGKHIIRVGAHLPNLFEIEAVAEVAKST
jgi:hypothetical protein